MLENLLINGQCLLMREIREAHFEPISHYRVELKIITRTNKLLIPENCLLKGVRFTEFSVRFGSVSKRNIGSVRQSEPNVHRHKSIDLSSRPIVITIVRVHVWTMS